MLSPTLMPSRFSTCARISSPPHSMQEMLVHTEMLVPADRLGLEHRIEGRDLVHLDRRQAEVLGDGVHRSRASDSRRCRAARRAAPRSPPSACDRAETSSPSDRSRGATCSDSARACACAGSCCRSPVDFPEDDVLRADHRHHVGEQVALAPFPRATRDAGSPARGTSGDTACSRRPTRDRCRTRPWALRPRRRSRRPARSSLR